MKIEFSRERDCYTRFRDMENGAVFEWDNCKLVKVVCGAIFLVNGMLGPHVDDVVFDMNIAFRVIGRIKFSA